MEIWHLQESTERERGLQTLSIPCATLAAGWVEADHRAGRLLPEDVHCRVWRNYGLPDSGHLCRQLTDGTWQHLIRVPLVTVTGVNRAEFTLTGTDSDFDQSAQMPAGPALDALYELHRLMEGTGLTRLAVTLEWEGTY